MRLTAQAGGASLAESRAAMSKVGCKHDCFTQLDAAFAALPKEIDPPPPEQMPAAALAAQWVPVAQGLDEYDEAFDKLDSYLARATLKPAVSRPRVTPPPAPAQTVPADRPRIAFRAASITSTAADLRSAVVPPVLRARRDNSASLGRLSGTVKDLASIHEALTLEHKAKMAFPSAQAEIAEGGRCFGLGRHTGCVFHMVRAAEYGLSALAHATDARRAVENTAADWIDVIAQIEIRVAAIETWREEPKKLAALAFFQNALRDVRFMHAAAHKLAHSKSFFDAPQAATICQTTREFITRLSARVSESQKRTLSRTDF
jgi:hypothetical protein